MIVHVENIGSGARPAAFRRGRWGGVMVGTWMLSALGALVLLGREQALAAGQTWLETRRALAAAVVSPKFSKKAGHGRWLGDET